MPVSTAFNHNYDILFLDHTRGIYCTCYQERSAQESDIEDLGSSMSSLRKPLKLNNSDGCQEFRQMTFVRSHAAKRSRLSSWGKKEGQGREWEPARPACHGSPGCQPGLGLPARATAYHYLPHLLSDISSAMHNLLEGSALGQGIDQSCSLLLSGFYF